MNAYCVHKGYTERGITVWNFVNYVRSTSDSFWLHALCLTSSSGDLRLVLTKILRQTECIAGGEKDELQAAETDHWPIQLQKK